MFGCCDAKVVISNKMGGNVLVSEIDEILDTVTGYSDGFYRILGRTGMSAEALNELLLDHNIEKCPNCGIYTDSFNLIGDDCGDEPDGFCDNCRAYNKPRED